MRRASIIRLAAMVLALGLVTRPQVVVAQDHAGHSTVSAEQLAVYGKAFAAIATARDQSQAEFAQTKNKTPEAQRQLHEKLLQTVAKVLQDHKLTQEQYNQITYAISTDTELRKSFDKLMGFTPPQPTATAPPAAGSNNPHVAHVTTSFNGTPNNQGLLPVALAEAKVVVDHAALAARATTNLEQMKTHAGHVIHAIEPAEGSRGPGSGYGLKKAANNVAVHIDMAGKAQGASQNVATHATHIAASAKNTVTRADQIIAVAKQIQAATTAEEAAKLVAEMNKLAGQLSNGVDANGDGRTGWQEGEGGLAMVEQHVTLMNQAEAAAAPPAAAPGAPMAVPSNPHLAHVTTAFNNTPGGQGLLPVALAEAKVVTDHAALAARASANLDQMKTHAGHIIHAIEPAEAAATRGPGAGYGLKKAATNVATHVELAAKVAGAPTNVTQHAPHVATAAKNTAARADQIMALAKQIQAATTAADAAKLVEQLNKLASQLTAGVDANGDGRVTWNEGEGGLQLLEQHLGFMLQSGQ